MVKSIPRSARYLAAIALNQLDELYRRYTNEQGITPEKGGYLGQLAGCQ